MLFQALQLNRTREKAVLVNRPPAVRGLGRSVFFLLCRDSPASLCLCMGFDCCAPYEGTGRNVILKILIFLDKQTKVSVQKR